MLTSIRLTPAIKKISFTKLALLFASGYVNTGTYLYLRLLINDLFYVILILKFCLKSEVQSGTVFNMTTARP